MVRSAPKPGKSLWWSLVALFGAGLFWGDLLGWWAPGLEPAAWEWGVAGVISAGLFAAGFYGFARLGAELKGAPCVDRQCILRLTPAAAGLAVGGFMFAYLMNMRLQVDPSATEAVAGMLVRTAAALAVLMTSFMFARNRLAAYVRRDEPAGSDERL